MKTLHPIAAARKSAGLSQEKLAHKLKVSRGAVAQWEMKRGTRPDPDNAIRLTQVLPGLSLDRIYARAA